jgi:hydroxyethylthiazole kinase-like uncharacterized protein yjeF
MDVLTGSRMRQVDEETIKRFCPGIELMERAGRQVAEFILEHYPADGFKASIFAGPGNNGGDAFVLARYLTEQGRRCSILCLGDPNRLAPDALKNYQRLLKRMPDNPGLKEINVTRRDWTSVVRKDFLDSTVIVDGLFGTGLARDLEGKAAEMVALINNARRPVVSIDIPSGIHSDSGAVLGDAVRANYTITMGYPKIGMLFYPGKSCVGELSVADLGFPDEVLQVNSLGIYLLNRHEAARRLGARNPQTHKYDAGVVLLVAGSRRYSGAAILAAEAALRAGCGMVYAAVPEGLRPIVQGRLPEVIVLPLPETQGGAIAETAFDALSSHFEAADAVVLGPGLGDEPETLAFARRFAAVERPLVLDADGLRAFDGEAEAFKDRKEATILTPHSGELKRLVGRDVPAEPLKRIEMTREVARELGAVLIHKGAPSVISSPQGDVWVNHSGNSALATAGTGDVLAGLVGGFGAQIADEKDTAALDAACVACFLHGRAGERAAGMHGLRGVIAGDLMRHLGGALIELEALAG